jgi:hypothetical protein
MATQTTYSERMLDNSPGTIQGSDHESETGICETAAPGGIPFGVAVSQGTLSDQGVVIGGSLAGFRGVAAKVVTLGAEQDKYLPPNNMTILHKGTIWVEPNEAVTADAAVYFVAATGVFSDNAAGAVGPIKGARWKTSCGIGGRALLQLSGHNKDV